MSNKLSEQESHRRYAEKERIQREQEERKKK